MDLCIRTELDRLQRILFRQCLRELDAEALLKDIAKSESCSCSCSICVSTMSLPWKSN